MTTTTPRFVVVDTPHCRTGKFGVRDTLKGKLVAAGYAESGAKRIAREKNREAASAAPAPVAAGRPNTLARWDAACARVAERNIRVLAHRDGRAIVSSSNGRDAYMTDGHTCSCRAAVEGDPICVHRAALSLHLAAITPVPPTPAAPAVAAAVGRFEVVFTLPTGRVSRSVRFGTAAEVGDWAELVARRTATAYNVARAAVGLSVVGEYLPVAA